MEEDWSLLLVNCYMPLENVFRDILVKRGRIVEVGKSMKRQGDTIIDCSRENLVLFPCSYNAHSHLRYSKEGVKLLDGSRDSLSAYVSRAVKEGVCGGIIEFSLSDLEAGVVELEGLNPHIRERIKIGVIVSGDELLEQPEAVEKALARIIEVGERPVLGVYGVLHELSRLGNYLSRYRERFRAIIDYHVSLTKDELYYSREKYSKYPIEVLYMEKMLGENTLVSCPGWITTWELDLLSNSGTQVVLCPSLQSYSLSGGIVYYDILASKRLLGGFSTCSYPSYSIWREAWLYLLLQRQIFHHSTTIDEKAIVLLASKPSLLILGGETWPLKPGAPADFLLYERPEVEERLLFPYLVEEKPVYAIIGGHLYMEGLESEL